eukprot:318073-Chlamydomonas_euryale.AAC.1
MVPHRRLQRAVATMVREGVLSTLCIDTFFNQFLVCVCVVLGVVHTLAHPHQTFEGWEFGAQTWMNGLLACLLDGWRLEDGRKRGWMDCLLAGWLRRRRLEDGRTCGWVACLLGCWLTRWEGWKGGSSAGASPGCTISTLHALLAQHAQHAPPRP